MVVNPPTPCRIGKRSPALENRPAIEEPRCRAVEGTNAGQQAEGFLVWELACWRALSNGTAWAGFVCNSPSCKAARKKNARSQIPLAGDPAELCPPPAAGYPDPPSLAHLLRLGVRPEVHGHPPSAAVAGRSFRSPLRARSLPSLPLSRARASPHPPPRPIIRPRRPRRPAATATRLRRVEGRRGASKAKRRCLRCALSSFDACSSLA